MEDETFRKYVESTKVKTKTAILDSIDQITAAGLTYRQFVMVQAQALKEIDEELRAQK